MGLDSVELVMAIEEEIGIDIPNEDAEQMVTVGDVYEWLKARIASTSPIACLTQKIFYKLRRALIENYQLERHVLSPDTRLSDLLPLKVIEDGWPYLKMFIDLQTPRFKVANEIPRLSVESRNRGSSWRSRSTNLVWSPRSCFALGSCSNGFAFIRTYRTPMASVVLQGAGAHIRVIGKGRKERCTPLTKQTTAVLKTWKRESAKGGAKTVSPNARGGQLSADGLQYILSKHVAVAQQTCQSLVSKRVTPHTLRHTLAMELMQSGVDRAMIALWLGHESVETTQIYLHANLALKEEILSKTSMPGNKLGRFHPDDQLLSFLSGL